MADIGPLLPGDPAPEPRSGPEAAPLPPAEAPPPRRPPAGNVSFLLQLALGSLAVFVAAAAGVGLAMPILPSEWGGLAFLFFLAFAVAACVYAGNVLRWPGFVAGFLIAIGLSVVGLGICVAVVASL